mmetsp:Transcript_21686/g.53570  ORF Transcript_21686/g.53570 Transcript_21686/m.53570 type:complete len:321 (-) Transcript_21686:804-1766(-)
MEVTFDRAPRAMTKTCYFDSNTPLKHPADDSLFSTKIPTKMEMFGLESAAMSTILRPHVVESQSYQPIDDILCEKTDLLEPAPISHERFTPAPSLDLKLLQDILNTAADEVNDSLDDSCNTKKRKASSAECHSLLERKRRTARDAPNFRPYQESKWVQQFDELIKFKEQCGHCNVPHSYKPELGMSRWVKRQRYQYKLRSQGKVSTMTEARIKELQSIGFVWDAHAATWLQRFEELKHFRSRLGHCNVPSSFTSNPQLVSWVKCQRRQYRLFSRNNALSSMTRNRIVKLEEIGFKWRVRDVPEESSPSSVRSDGINADSF